MKRTWDTSYVDDFSADYEATDVDHMKDIQKYLMKKKKWYNVDENI